MKINKKLLFILLVAVFLRFWQLNKIPPSLFGDELDVGYHAYSILHTGKDYYGDFMPLHFHSLAEWRTPLYLYSVVPTVAIWGISPLGVRVPAAFFGVLGVWAMYLLVRELNKKDKKKVFNIELEYIAAFLLAISPWHIQFSRAAFEVTQMIFFFIFGLYLLFRFFETKKHLWISALLFGLMPWVYSTAKVFTPMLIAIVFLLWRKEFLKQRKESIRAFVALAVTLIPLAWLTLFGGAAQRFGYIGIFSDPTIETEIGVARQLDAYNRGELTTGISPTFTDRLMHNKFVVWGEDLTKNYSQALSTDFLFNSGDPNPRHSPNGVGEFYFVELFALLAGIIYVFSKLKDTKLKWLYIFLALGAVLPAALTRDGGNHATRLILLLPVLTIFVSYGIISVGEIRQKLVKLGIVSGFVVLFLIEFVLYQHLYWGHYKYDSERWWHYGWSQAVTYVKEHQSEYDKVIITSNDEPPWIFFAANYEYPPTDWQNNFPLDNKVNLEGYGEVSHIGKFYFGSPHANGIYEYGQFIDKHTLYLASQKEVKVNLIQEPGRTPADLKLLDSVAYPSGEPAFYLFTGK